MLSKVPVVGVKGYEQLIEILVTTTQFIAKDRVKRNK
jgi:hypothetical protein